MNTLPELICFWIGCFAIFSIGILALTWTIVILDKYLLEKLKKWTDRWIFKQIKDILIFHRSELSQSEQVVTYIDEWLNSLEKSNSVKHFKLYRVKEHLEKSKFDLKE